MKRLLVAAVGALAALALAAPQAHAACPTTRLEQKFLPWLDPARYFEVGDREDLSYEQKLAEYRKLADDYFQVDAYTEFCATALAHVDELILDWVASPEFDALLLETVKSTYPEHEQEEFAAHFRGLLGLWVHERGRTPQTVQV